MKVKVLRDLTAGGIEDSTSFGLSRVDESHIMTILRDTLYSLEVAIDADHGRLAHLEMEVAAPNLDRVRQQAA